MTFYNDNNPYCCSWLESLIAARIIPFGVVDCSSIKRLDSTRLARYTQVHLFAGMGGWAYALRLAGWPDDRPVWTGSCPCQPFSVAGKGKGARDKRHLWPDMYRLIRGARPVTVMGEQVAGKAGYGWFDGVLANLEKEGYEGRAVDIPSCGVNAPHIRQRLYWVAHSKGTIKQEHRTITSGMQSGSTNGGGLGGGLGHPHNPRLQRRIIQIGQYACECVVGETSVGGWMEDPNRSHFRQISPTRQFPQHEYDPGRNLGFWDDYTLVGPDPTGLYRRVKPGIRLLANGVPSRISKLVALGNSINPILAAQVIRAYMDVYPQ